MENLIWIIAIGALFYFMMRRGGCGGGHSHGGHGDNDQKHNHGAGGHDDQSKNKSGGCH